MTFTGLPFGLECFQLARLSLWPFDKDVILKEERDFSSISNIFWMLFTGAWVSLFYIAEGAVLCCLILGIPWGLQKFKMAKLAFLPFGAEIK